MIPITDVLDPILEALVLLVDFFLVHLHSDLLADKTGSQGRLLPEV
jgi:hypothetical protein